MDSYINPIRVSYHFAQVGLLKELLKIDASPVH